MVVGAPKPKLGWLAGTIHTVIVKFEQECTRVPKLPSLLLLLAARLTPVLSPALWAPAAPPPPPGGGGGGEYFIFIFYHSV